MSQTVLKLNDIVKKYQDGESERVILNHINLEVHEGEFVAIVGPSDYVVKRSQLFQRRNGRIYVKRISALFSRTTSFFLILKPENSLRPC
nr:hypothetical protein [uncultured Sharpea sp.]